MDNSYNVIQAGKVIYYGDRFSCEQFITEHRFRVLLVDEPNRALHVG